MKCHVLFFGQNKKNISKCHLLKFLPNMLNVKIRSCRNLELVINNDDQYYFTFLTQDRWS